MSITDRIHVIQQRIEACLRSCGREQDNVRLLVVTKRQSVDAIREAIHCGQQCFGESVVQEAIPKIQTLQNHSLEWHMIGPLQSNKARAIAEHFDWVHSIDRIKIAERLQYYRDPLQPLLNVCIQVNVSGESQKQGVAPSDVSDFVQAMRSYDRLCVRGLMAIPRRTDDVAEQCEAYTQLFSLYQSVEADSHWDTLSMGMSGDFEAAIRAGSNLVRIGQGIFQ